MSIRKELLGSQLLDGSSNPIVSTEMNALANNALVLASVINSSTGVISNVANDGQGLGYPLCWLQLGLAAFATAPTANTSVDGWFLTALDGTNYESGSASITPARNPDFVFPLISQTAAQIVKILAFPPICATIKILVRNNGTGQALGATLNTIKYFPLTDQMV